MNIGLYNVDSKLPNLALMKLSAYHKAKGDTVDWCNSPIEAMTFDKVYGSQVFTDSVRWDAPNLVMGGSGYDLDSKLPEEIEETKPRINYGFTTRGCIRNCYFCIVPRKEGYIRIVGDIYDIWDGVSDSIVLYDNNILALPEHFTTCLEQASKEGIKIDYNQGLDIRLMTEIVADTIFKYKQVLPRLVFALDSNSYIDEFCRGMEKLKKRKLVSRIQVLVLIDNSNPMPRFKAVKRYGLSCFAMHLKGTIPRCTKEDLAWFEDSNIRMPTGNKGKVKKLLKYNKKGKGER